MSFSERTGLGPARPLKRGSMNGALRNGRWNAVYGLLERMESGCSALKRMSSYGPTPGMALLERIWVDYALVIIQCTV